MFNRNRTPEKPKTPAQKIKETELRIELDAIERAARFDREQEEHERDIWRKNVAEVDELREKITKISMWRDRGRKAIPFVPLVIVNLAALGGQFSWALDHLKIGNPGTIARVFASAIYAIAVESIALFLQYYANRALKNRDSAAMLYLGAFVVAGLVALINFSHFYDPKISLINLSTQATAYAFALCSLVSPWLWRVHSRAESREELKAAGEIDSRGVKLSLSRKIWHPWRSLGVISLSAWTGETTPTKAVADWETKQAEKSAAKEAKADETDTIREEAAKRRVDLKRQRQPKIATGTNGDHTKHPKYLEGVNAYRDSLKGPGKAMSQRDLATYLRQKNRVLAAAIIKDVKNGVAP